MSKRQSLVPAFTIIWVIELLESPNYSELEESPPISLCIWKIFAFYISRSLLEFSRYESSLSKTFSSYFCDLINTLSKVRLIYRILSPWNKILAPSRESRMYCNSLSLSTLIIASLRSRSCFLFWLWKTKINWRDMSAPRAMTLWTPSNPFKLVPSYSLATPIVLQKKEAPIITILLRFVKLLLRISSLM